MASDADVPLHAPDVERRRFRNPLVGADVAVLDACGRLLLRPCLATELFHHVNTPSLLLLFSWPIMNHPCEKGRGKGGWEKSDKAG